MRCKVGDLVVIVRAHKDKREYLGRICAITGKAQTADWVLDTKCSEPGWIVVAYDDEVRPIRDNDGEDEILRIAGKPIEKPSELSPRKQVEFAR